MALKVYYASMSGSKEIKKKQLNIFDYLDSNKYEYEKIDIATDTEKKEEMRAKVKESGGKDMSLPPQIFKGDEYLGDYDEFESAQEGKCLEEFLKKDDASQQEQKL